MSTLRHLNQFDHVWQGLFSIQVIDASSDAKLVRTSAKRPALYDQFGFEKNSETAWREAAGIFQEGLNRRTRQFKCRLSVAGGIEIQCRVVRFGKAAISFELDLPRGLFCIGCVGQSDLGYPRIAKLKIAAFDDAVSRLIRRTNLEIVPMWPTDDGAILTIFRGPKVPRKSASVLAQLVGSSFFGWQDSLTEETDKSVRQR